MIFLFIGSAYVRFMVIHDYNLTYEGTCEAEDQVCFIGCEDDECNSEYYYSKVTKYAPNLYKECGTDVSQCEAAYSCKDDEVGCDITYCNPNIEADLCETIDSDTLDIDEEEKALNETLDI